MIYFSIKQIIFIENGGNIMANRPKLKTLQNGIEDLREKYRDHEERLKAVEEREIVRMLQETNRPGVSSKPRYTYMEIAEEVGVSASKVCTIAEKNGLSRSQIKAVK